MKPMPARTAGVLDAPHGPGPGGGMSWVWQGATGPEGMGVMQEWEHVSDVERHGAAL